MPVVGDVCHERVERYCIRPGVPLNKRSLHDARRKLALRLQEAKVVYLHPDDWGDFWASMEPGDRYEIDDSNGELRWGGLRFKQDIRIPPRCWTVATEDTLTQL